MRRCVLGARRGQVETRRTTPRRPSSPPARCYYTRPDSKVEFLPMPPPTERPFPLAGPNAIKVFCRPGEDPVKCVAFGGPLHYNPDGDEFEVLIKGFFERSGNLVEVVREVEDRYWLLDTHYPDRKVLLTATVQEGGNVRARVAALRAELPGREFRHILVTQSERNCGQDRPTQGQDLEESFLSMVPELQKLQAEGLIGSYGLESDCFGLPAGHPRHVSLDRLFRDGVPAGMTSIRFPVNLLQAGVMTRRNCAGGTQTAAEFANERGLALLGSHPLHGFDSSGAPVRLQSFHEYDGRDLATKLKKALDDAVHLELQYPAMAKRLAEAGHNPPPPRHMSWVQIVGANLESLLNASRWEDAYHKNVRIGLIKAMRQLGKINDPAVVEWLPLYRATCLVFLRRVSEAAHFHDSQLANAISREVDEACPSLARSVVGSLEAQSLFVAMASGVDVLFTHPYSRCILYGDPLESDDGTPRFTVDRRRLYNLLSDWKLPTRADALHVMARTEAKFGGAGSSDWWY